MLRNSRLAGLLLALALAAAPAWGQTIGPAPGSSTSGTVTSLTAGAGITLSPSTITTTGSIAVTNGGIPAATAAGSTLLVTAAMSNGDILLNTASGSVCTLPAATGSGKRYRFIVTVAASSNSHQILAKTNGSTLIGWTYADNATNGIPVLWTVTAGNNTVTLNGAGTGGLNPGDWIEVRDIAINLWAVTGETLATNSGFATPFSTQ